MSGSGTTGYDEGMLTQVINATDAAIRRMEAENNVVQGISTELPMVNVSRAGQLLGSAIGEWTQSYNVIINALIELNGRAMTLRGSHGTVADDAAATAL